MLHRYSEPFRLNGNQFGGGLFVFIREDNPCGILNTKSLTMKALFIGLNLRKRKWLLCCSYNLHKNLIVAHLREIQVALDVLSSKYENIIIIGDFNSEPIWKDDNMENLINNFTCYKTLINQHALT